jgi:hypothetical protein
MSVIDTLTILIDADASGIQKVLKTSINTVKGGVEQMNNEEVDWTSIFTRSVSPALIGAVASMFALAISNLVNFNNAATNLNNVATPATNALSNGLGLASDAAANLALNSGASLGDATSAFEAFTKAGLDSAAATAATTDAAGIARDTGQSMSSVVTELVGLFQNWGVKTLPQVTDALTGLVNAAGSGKFTFQQLVDTISSSGSVLSSKTDISSVSLQLATLSNQSGLTQTAIIASFNGIVSGVADPLNQMNTLIGGGVGTISKDISSGPNGLITAFGQIQTAVDKFGPAAATVLEGTGIPADVLSSYSTLMPNAMAKTAAAYDDLLKNHIIPLDQYLATHEPISGKLWSAFNDLITILSALVSGSYIKDIEDFIAKLTGNGQGILSEILGSTGLKQYTGPGGASAQGGVNNGISTTNNSSSVNLNTNINIANSSPAAILGSQIAKQLYNLFQGINH